MSRKVRAAAALPNKVPPTVLMIVTSCRNASGFWIRLGSRAIILFAPIHPPMVPHSMHPAKTRKAMANLFLISVSLHRMSGCTTGCRKDSDRVVAGGVGVKTADCGSRISDLRDGEWRAVCVGDEGTVAVRLERDCGAGSGDGAGVAGHVPSSGRAELGLPLGGQGYVTAVHFVNRWRVPWPIFMACVSRPASDGGQSRRMPRLRDGAHLAERDRELAPPSGGTGSKPRSGEPANPEAATSPGQLAVERSVLGRSCGAVFSECLHGEHAARQGRRGTGGEGPARTATDSG